MNLDTQRVSRGSLPWQSHTDRKVRRPEAISVASSAGTPGITGVAGGVETHHEGQGRRGVERLSAARGVVVPCTVKAAMKWVRETHRHLPKIQGGLFAAAWELQGEIVGVAIAGNPSRVWQQERKIVISRVATIGAENACSALYGSLCRAAKALGYVEAWTYTLPEEDGASLRAAGFEFMGHTRGGSYDRPCRHRDAPVNGEPKGRWRRSLV